MGNYENLKQSITEVIRTNGNQEITGAVLQSTLLTIISSVGANATFVGIATPTTNPGTPDGPVFYLASEGGTYTNFNAIELQDGLSVLMWNGSWSSQQVFGIDNEPTAGSDNLVKSGGVNKRLYNNCFIGDNDNFRYTTIYGLAINTEYRLILQNPDYDRSGVTVHEYSKSIFIINSVYNNVTSQLKYFATTVTSLPQVIEFTIPQNCDYIEVGGRATLGEVVRFSIETNLHTEKMFLAENKLQFYNSDNSITDIEETFTVNGSIFIHDTRWAVRVLVNFSYSNNNELATAMGVSVVTSPKGYENCIEIQDTYCLIFDSISKIPKIVSRDSVTSTDIVLISCVDGRIRRLSYGMESSVLLPRIKNIEDTIKNIDEDLTAVSDVVLFDKKAQFYNNGSAYPIIKKVGTSLYFKSSNGQWAGRASLNLNYASNEALATEIGVSLVDISESDTGYIELQDIYSFVIDGNTKKPIIKQRDSIAGSDTVLLANVDGHIKGLNTDLFGYPYIEHLFDEFNTKIVDIDDKYILLEDKYLLPSTVAENTDVLIPQIRSHKSSKSVTFGFVTDLHNNALQVQYDKNNSVIKKIHNIVKGINEINSNCLVSAMIIGGDYLLNNNNTTYQMAVDALSDFSATLRKIDHTIPLLICKGNHDSNTMGALVDCLNDNDFYKWCNSIFENNEIVIDSDNPSGCYGYFDIKPQKIRIIFLNSQDIPWIIQNDSLKYKGQWVKGIQQAQLDFVKKALTFDESGWGVIFASHHGVVEIEGYSINSDSYITPENGGSQLYGIIKAFKDKTTFSSTITGDFASVVSVDFTNNASNQVICLLNGHTHCDRNAVKDGMLFLSTTTATQSNVDPNTDGSSYTPVANTKNEAAMDFITVDKLSGIIYLDRYGFGVSRKFYYTGEDIGEIPT